MSLETLFSLMSGTDTDAAIEPSEAVQVATSHRSEGQSPEEYAFVEVNPDGTIRNINPFGRISWGWRTGMGIPRHLLIALDALEEEVPTDLPLTEGGLNMRAISRTGMEGWFIVGYRPEDGTHAGRQLTFRHLADRVPLPVFSVNAAGLGWYVNDAAARMMDDEPESAMGHPVLARIIHPEDRWKLSDLMQLAAAEGMARACVRIGPYGTESTLFLVQAGRDEYHGLLQPSQDSSIFEESEQAESFYRSFLEQSPLGVVHLDADGRITFENHQFRDLIGDEAEDSWLGLLISEVEAVDEETADCLMTVCKEGSTTSQLATFTSRDGTVIAHVRFHASGIRHPENGVVGAVIAFDDRTTVEAQKQELERHRRLERVENALREIATTSPDATIFRDAGVRTFADEFEADRVSLLGLSIGRDAFVEVAGYRHDANVESERADESPAVLIQRSELSDLESSARESGLVGEDDSSECRLLCDRLKLEKAWIAPVSDNGHFAGLLVFGWEQSDSAGADQFDTEQARHLASLFESLYSWIQVGARYRTTVSSIDDALFGFSFRADESRHYHFTTRQIEHLIGRTPGEVATDDPRGVRWVDDIVHEEDRALVRAHNKTLLAGHESRITYRILHTDDSIRWLLEHSTPRTDATGMTAVSGILSDVTEQKTAELVLLQAKREAEASNRAKTSFIATMSHEIRTPLGAVNGYSELLRHELEELEEELGQDLPDQVHEFISAISDRSGKLLSLVTDLFDLSNLESGLSGVGASRVALTPILRRTLNEVRSELDRKGVRLRLHEHDGDLQLAGDQKSISKIFQNLLSNAVKFTEEGSITVSTRSEGPEAVVSIKDTGIGISESYQANLFEAFTQEEDWRNRTYEGTGLGLALTRRILDMLGGRIDVESSKGVGSTFTVRLPLYDSAGTGKSFDHSQRRDVPVASRNGVRFPGHSGHSV